MLRPIPFLFLFLSLAPGALAQSISWITDCANKTFCLNPGSCSEGDVLIVEKAVTTCASSSIVNYSYKVDLHNNGSIDIQSSDDTLKGTMPAGTHRVTWRASDNCGNLNTNCGYLVTVKDCAPPNLLCINGLTQNLELPECSATFDAESFIISVSDNCTPKNDIVVGIRETGTGMGFPTDTNITFSGCEQGLHVLQIWVKDANNLVNICNSYVLVQDNTGICECNIDADITLHGCAQTVAGAKLSNYTVRADLSGPSPVGDIFLQKTYPDSCFDAVFAALPFNGSYSGVLRARRYGDPLEGVSTFDLVLINKHILAQQPLQNFYQVFAADVNQSQTISTSDIVEVRKLILGLYDTLPNTPSWRLIRPIADPANLVNYAAVRDTYQFSIPNLSGDMTLNGFNFVGVKMGDANSNAALLGPADDRSGAPLGLRLDGERRLDAGESAWIPVWPEENLPLEGWQLALQFDETQLDIQDIRGIPANCVALYPGELRLSWIGEPAAGFGPEAPLFWLLLRAQEAVRLSDAGLRLSPVLSAEAYPAGTAALRRPMVLNGGAAPEAQAVFFPPQPNPTSGAAVFPLRLPAEAEVELELLDGQGRRAYRSVQLLEAGYWQVDLPAEALPGAGLWWYRIRAGAAEQSGRLLRW
ncbi:MAG: hypothetical protein IT260_01285 [Saprospiraceae bacterium]|nr:hypothetical protein [Saprospiraceae bacterium]